MIIPKKQRSRLYTVLQILGLIALFTCAFLLGLATMNLVYGYDFANSTAYNEVMNATKNASQYALNLNATGE